MNVGHRTVPELSSDPARTKRMADALLRRFQDYINARREVTYQDAFMAAHNFHRVAVLFLADRMGMTGDTRRIYFTMAAQTFTSSLMRDHVRLEEDEHPEQDGTTGTIPTPTEPPPQEEP